MPSEIFRHFRPVWFDKNRGTLTPLPNGGITFLFLPASEPLEYNYWIYVCPADAIFSSKAALKRLREVASMNIKPWGKISITDEPIIMLAVKSLMSEQDELPTTVAETAFRILSDNFKAQHEMDMFVSKSAKEFYVKED